MILIFKLTFNILCYGVSFKVGGVVFCLNCVWVGLTIITERAVNKSSFSFIGIQIKYIDIYIQSYSNEFLLSISIFSGTYSHIHIHI